MLTKEQIEEIVQGTLNHARPGMRIVIGDASPRQYDKADQMANYIALAVRRALADAGLAEPPA